MKKIFTLLLFALAAFGFNSNAQPGTTCNAEFSVQYLTGSTVKFIPVHYNDSIHTEAIWNFGDGNWIFAPNINLAPTHTYAAPGTYQVGHRVSRYTSGNVCTDTFTRTVVIGQTTNCNLVANFTWHPDSVNHLKIWFTNTSVPQHPSDSIRWTFGDGTSSNAVNPTHIYSQPGTYTVCLRVQKMNTTGPNSCIREICKTIVIPPNPSCNLVANFLISQLSAPPLTYHFQNTSVPLHNTDSIRWTFGDGTSSNQVHPNHTYTSPGTYTVCLRIQQRNSAGQPTNCVREICKTLTIPPICNIEPRWTWQPDPNNWRRIHFTNLTTPPTVNVTATWSFGDGTTASSWNAVHEYANAGRYYVCLKIQIGPNCIRYKCDSITVVAPQPPCTQLSKFHYEKFNGDNQKYKFTPDYISNAIQYTWTFGDGTGSHDPIAVHRYAQPGVYTACLTAWRGPDCASTTCHEIRVLPQINCDSIHVTYTYQRDPFVPNKIYFYAIANFPILLQTWTITKIPATVNTPPVVLHQNNPVYVFRDTGYYRVCLKAITLGGCVKEYCQIIRIDQVATNICELQAYPNPTNNLVNVNVNLTVPEMIHAYVYNSANVLVREKHQQGHTGNNIVTIEVAGLVSGLYTIKLIYGNKICFARFHKL